MEAHVHTVEGDYEIDDAGGVTIHGDVVLVLRQDPANRPADTLAAIKLSDNTFVFLGDNPPRKVELPQ